MARYGLDYYSSKDFPLSYYGSDNPLNYDASPVFAVPSGFHKISLLWNSPIGPWVKLRIIRSPYGYPVNITDGDQVFETTRIADIGYYQDVTSFLNPDSRVYFYSIFVYDSIQLTWFLAGRTSAVSVKNYGTTDKMYSYVPQAYKIQTPYIASEPADNPVLYKFLSLFGFELDFTRALADSVKDRYNFESVNASTIPLLLNQFGITYEPEIGYQQARIIARDSVQLTKEKGSSQGLREYIKGFTGWACPKPIAGTPNPSVDGLVVSHNLMLDYNDSSFEEGVGHWMSPDSTATIKNPQVDTVTKFFSNNNVLRLIIGTNGYSIGDQITVTGFKNSRYNSFSAVAIIGVDNTSYIEVATNSPDIALDSAYNPDTGAFPVITPFPAPYSEPTTPSLYPNKQKGILALSNATGIAQAVTIACGQTSPKTLGIPITSGDTYTFSIYSAAKSTTRSFTTGISWYDRFGVFMATTTGTPATNATGTISTRASVTAAGPCAITLNPFVNTAGSGYSNGSYTNVPLTYVSGKQFSTAPLANISILNGSVQSVAIVNGGKGSDTTTIFSFDKASINSPGGSGFLATVARVQESYYAVPVVTVSNVANAASGERHYFDCAQFEKANSATSFDEARQIHITMKANRINEIINPTFSSANSFAPWGFTNGTASATTAQSDPLADVLNIEGYQQAGTSATISLSTVHAFKAGDSVTVSGLPSPYSGVNTVDSISDFTISYTVSPSATVNFTTATGTVAKTGNACIVTKVATGNTEVKAAAASANYINIYYPNTYYTGSFYVRRLVGTAAPTVTVSISWYNISKTLINTNTSTVTTLSTTTNWTRVSFSDVAPSNAAYANVTLTWTNGAASDQIVVDNALFENSAFVLPYFDGSQGFSTSAELLWEGQLPNASRSHYYKNNIAIQSRLVKGALDEWLISGSTYALYLAQPKT